MNRISTILRTSKEWLQSYSPEILFYLFVASVVATCVDIISTWVALSIWLDIFAESIPLTGCMMKLMGLEQALILLLCIRISFSYLLYNSYYRTRIRFIGLLAMTSGGLYVGIKNTYYIIQILMV
jgi:hypothetical protein